MAPTPVSASKYFSPHQLLAIKRPLLQKRTTTVISEDVPTVYKVENLRQHEFPVIGLVVHPRIIPGFSYRVRPLNTSKYLFNGSALQLCSVGKGYGKRISFKSDEGQKNGNMNFFWSDSRDCGFGFELEVVSPGDKFTIYDANHEPWGNCEVISNEDPQVEQSHLTWPESGVIEKWVLVKLRCRIQSVDGLHSEDVISGIAIASKPSLGVASITRIMNCRILKHTKKVFNNLTLMPGVTTHTRRITVCGDVPATYTISGLLSHEFPVIGTFVHQNILPGFHYIVRPSQSKLPLFSGKPLLLHSVGRGIGRRLTFESSSKNHNQNYFWSDSYPEGFGFSPRAVFEGHRFRIFVGEEEIGTAVVKKALKPQVELQMVQLPKGGILKRFRIDVNCEMELRNVVTRACRVSGIAVVVRNGINAVGKLEAIESPGLDSELNKNFRYISGEVKFIAFEHQKYLKDV